MLRDAIPPLSKEGRRGTNLPGGGHTSLRQRSEREVVQFPSRNGTLVRRKEFRTKILNRTIIVLLS